MGLTAGVKGISGVDDNNRGLGKGKRKLQRSLR